VIDFVTHNTAVTQVVDGDDRRCFPEAGPGKRRAARLLPSVPGNHGRIGMPPSSMHWRRNGVSFCLIMPASGCRHSDRARLQRRKGGRGAFFVGTTARPAPDNPGSRCHRRATAVCASVASATRSRLHGSPTPHDGNASGRVGRRGAETTSGPQSGSSRPLKILWPAES
jgi:hypothetical protein